MEPGSLTLSLGYRLGSQKIYDLREIFERFISFYFYKIVSFSNTSVIFDPIEQKWDYTFYAYNDNGIIKLPPVTRLKLISLSLENYIGMKLVTHSVLAYMSSISESVSLYYKSWGVLTEAKNLDRVQVMNIRREVEIYEKKYFYFIKSKAVLGMADKLKIFHTEFDRYVIVKKDRPVTEMVNMLGDILLEGK